MWHRQSSWILLNLYLTLISFLINFFLPTMNRRVHFQRAIGRIRWISQGTKSHRRGSGSNNNNIDTDSQLIHTVQTIIIIILNEDSAYKYSCNSHFNHNQRSLQSIGTIRQRKLWLAKKWWIDPIDVGLRRPWMVVLCPVQFCNHDNSPPTYNKSYIDKSFCCW